MFIRGLDIVSVISSLVIEEGLKRSSLRIASLM
jgi:hypothetical protein